MSSRCRTPSVVLAAGLALAGCTPRHRPAGPSGTPASYSLPPLSPLIPGDSPAPPEDPRGASYDGDPQAIAAGKSDFTAYNCAGCHFNGGGGIGPALMDQTWTYGGRIDEIHNSIAEGRPNGMPSWRLRIPDQQIWQLAAYVRSLSPPDSPPPPPAHLPATG